MQILLAEAKTMRRSVSDVAPTFGAFLDVAEKMAAEMAQMTVEDIAHAFRCSRVIALRVSEAYRQFGVAQPSPALLSYDGHAYKHLRADSLGADAMAFARQHLWITSFLYGLLRPQDAVVPYRMEAGLHLDIAGDESLARFWQPRLTPFLIESVQADDGVLVHLSTAEFTHLFNWSQVCREVNVIEPHFCVRKNGMLRVQAVWAKACRGAMVRYILEHRLSDPSALTAFSYEGFRYHADASDARHLCFVRED